MSVTTERPADDPTAPAGVAAPDDAPGSAGGGSTHGSWRDRLRPGRLSIGGGVLALVLSLMSVTPSFVPRGWTMQAALVAACALVGYAVGAFLGWAYRTLRLPVPPQPARRMVWLVLAVVAVLGLPAAAFFGRAWQMDQREMFGMDPDVPWMWVASPYVGVLVAMVLLAVGRLVKVLARLIFGPLVRVVPVRVAWLLAILATAFVVWLLVDGLVLRTALARLDAAFEADNRGDYPWATNPGSSFRSGGPASTVSWDSIGREGRGFIAQGLSGEQISGVVDDPAAEDPVLAYIGLGAAQDPEERAELAIAELRTLGGFQRGAIAVAGVTGRGWVDPQASQALQYATHGDVAIVTMQYSYLPSWMAFLVARDKAAADAQVLINRLRVELTGLPPDQRPRLYVFGESLGAFSADSAFTSVEDVSTTTDGALFIGPPNFDPNWKAVQAGRDPGSPLWKPAYGDGSLVRVAANARDITNQTLTWRTDSPVIYLAHDSDPVVGWVVDYGAWLDPRGPDTSPFMVAWPVVTFLQATVDQFGATNVPPGHGHVYDDTVVTAWSEIVGPPSLPREEIEAIRTAIADLPE
jgi:uncharacterized membrane protein